MTGRILIVDALPTNRIVLRVKLSGAFYDVVQADTGEAALAVLRKTPIDLVVFSANLQDVSGPKLCAALRRLPQARRLPIIALLMDEAPDTRRACLLAGADDVLERPLDDLILLARVRSLLRARDAEEELDMRDETSRSIGLSEAPVPFVQPATVVLTPATDAPALRRACSHLSAALQNDMPDRFVILPWDNLLRDADLTADVVLVIETPHGPCDGLALLPQLRANAATRHAGLHYVAHPHQRREAAAALDIGASDTSICGLEPQELGIRLRKLIAQKRTADRLRASMRDGLKAAVTDSLTGLYNRRYALPHLDRMAQRAAQGALGYAVLLADIDHFKTVNDSYGHAAGDQILTELAMRLRDGLRAADLLARFGGEEFLIALPDCTKSQAHATAERLCRAVAAQPFVLPDGTRVPVTISIGVSLSGQPPRAPQKLVESADLALYAAKDKGRNTVVMADTVTPLVAPDDRAARPAAPRKSRPRQRKA